jgi:hypothetical protein
MYWKVLILMIVIINYSCKPSKTKIADTPTFKQDSTYSNKSDTTIKRDFLHLDIVLDSLKTGFIKTHNEKYLLDIEKLALKSDASFTTDICASLAHIFTVNAKGLISFMCKHKSIRLREYLIDYWAGALSPYEGIRRKNELNKFRTKTKKVSNNQQFTPQEKEYLFKMLEEVDPSVFD